MEYYLCKRYLKFMLEFLESHLQFSTWDNACDILLYVVLTIFYVELYVRLITICYTYDTLRWT